MPLVSAALRLIGTPADDVIALQAQAQSVYDHALANGISQTKAGFIVTDAIAPFTFATLPGEETAWHEAPVTSTKQVRYLADRIYDACFVVVSYLVGARISEILGLQVGCIQQHPAGDGSESFAYLVGRIYKTARGIDGEAHRWVAPAPVERAVVVMERLTARLRAQSGRDDLFLAMASTGLVGPAARIDLPVGSTIIRLEEVLTATALAGKGGRMIAARSQFRGRTRDGDVQAYVTFLMKETDLRLWVCDWGYCVYRVETAACFGDERGPNPVLRTESTCLTCANFAVTARHRPVWQARRDRNADLLGHPDLDPVSRQLAETRIAECDRILGDLDHKKDGRYGA